MNSWFMRVPDQGGNWISEHKRGNGLFNYSISTLLCAITDKTWDKIIIHNNKAAPSLHQLRFQLKQHGHNLLNLLLKIVEYNLSSLLFQLSKAKRESAYISARWHCLQEYCTCYTKGQIILYSPIAMYIVAPARAVLIHTTYTRILSVREV